MGKLVAAGLLCMTMAGFATGVVLAPKIEVGPELDKPHDMFSYARERTCVVFTTLSRGSGVFFHNELEDDGTWTAYVLTAEHVIHMFPDDLIVGVYDADGELHSYVAQIEYYHGDMYSPADLAILRVEGLMRAMPTAQVLHPARARDLKAGQEVWLSGFPTMGFPHITDGYIQHVGPDRWETYLRVSSQISYGNSGGPLFLPDGRLVSVGVQVHVPGGMPSWHIARCVAPDHLYVFLSDAGFDYIFD